VAKHPGYFDPLDVGHPPNDFILVPSIFFDDGERGGSGVVTIREAKDRWSIEVDGVDVPLQKDFRLRVNGAAVTYKVKPEKLPEFIQCRLVDWEYQVTDSRQASLELTVEEPPPPISDNRAMGAIALAVLTCLVLVIQFHAFYVHPEDAWAFLGRHAQVWGSIGLAALFAVVLPSRIGLRERTGFRELFLTAILLWTGAVLIFLWVSLTRPALGEGQDYAAAGHAIAEKLRAHNWPIVIAALPWAAVVFKLLGFEVAEKTTEVVLEEAKKKD
jgi:hypothetical protein